MWPQSTLHTSLRKLFPAGFLDGVATPMLEDLVNSPTFSAWSTWLSGRGWDPCANLGAFEGAGSRGQQAAASARQGGALSSKRALPALLERGEGFRAQFNKALAYGKQGLLPWDIDVQVPHDLRFAARRPAANISTLQVWRLDILGALRELSDRCRPLTDALLKHQPREVASVAGRVHVGFMAVLVVLARWPDRALPFRFLSGFPIVGVLEETGIYERAPPSAVLDPDVLCAEGDSLLQELSRERTSEHASFLLDAAMVEAAKGWAAPPCRKEEIDSVFGRGMWAPIPTFVVVQPMGKRRVIHNGKRGRQNCCTSFTEHLSMISAFQPAVVARALAEEARAAGVPDECVTFMSGTEDMPDAFRSIPVLPEHHRFNVAAVRKEDGSWVFQRSWALLFGFSASVMQFERLSAFMEAVERRICCVAGSMYVDDNGLVDFACGAGSSQEVVGELFRLTGAPLAAHKRQPMSSVCEFLGLEHSFADPAAVAFWPKEGLVQKATTIIQGHLDEGQLTPGDASKLRGLLQFMSHAVWLGVGRAPMRPLKQRQYIDVPPWSLSNSLVRSLEFFLAVLQERPRRSVPLLPRAEPMVVIASDARADDSGPPSGGYVLFDTADGGRAGGFCEFPRSLLAMWGACDNPIALCEGRLRRAFAGVLGPALAGRRRHGAHRFGETFRITTEPEGVVLPRQHRVAPCDGEGRRAPSSCCGHQQEGGAARRGATYLGANHAALDRSVEYACFLRGCGGMHLWFEYVDSQGNWSDEISRAIRTFVSEQGVPVARFTPDQRIWQGTVADAWRRAKRAISVPRLRGLG